MAVSITTFLLLLALGCVVGILSGLLGIGGGMLMIPTFRLVFGMSAVATTATSLLVIIPTSLTGAISHIREKTCILWLGVSMGIGGACTSALGAYSASHAPSAVVMCTAAIIIGYSSFTMLRKALKKPAVQAPAEVQGKKSVASAANVATQQVEISAENAAAQQQATEHFCDHPTLKKCLIGFCIGLFAGFMAGFVGVGGGFIMVPLMTSVLGVSMHKASGTSLVGIAILALPGVIEHIVLGNVVYMAALAMCIGTIPGAIAGAKLCKRFSDRALRLIFGCMLLIVAGFLIANEFVA